SVVALGTRADLSELHRVLRGEASEMVSDEVADDADLRRLHGGADREETRVAGGEGGGAESRAVVELGILRRRRRGGSGARRRALCFFLRDTAGAERERAEES